MRHTDRYKYGSLNKANEFRIEWNRLCVERDRDRDREGERKAGILIRFCFFCFFVWLFYSPLATVSSEQVNERNVRIVHGIWCACVCRCCRRDDTTENKQSHVAQHEIPNKSKQIPLEENDDGCDAGLAYMHSNCVFCVRSRMVRSGKMRVSALSVVMSSRVISKILNSFSNVLSKSPHSAPYFRLARYSQYGCSLQCNEQFIFIFS